DAGVTGPRMAEPRHLSQRDRFTVQLEGGPVSLLEHLQPFHRHVAAALFVLVGGDEEAQHGAEDPGDGDRAQGCDLRPAAARHPPAQEFTLLDGVASGAPAAPGVTTETGAGRDAVTP